jgi:transposase-like protein
MKANGTNPDGIPDPEVEPKAQHRYYTADYKQKILDEIDATSHPGEIGAILRREGLYSQIISKWRHQRQQRGLTDTDETKRGPKPHPQTAEVEKLEREKASLQARLDQAELIIDIQKKVSQLLGIDLTDPDHSGRRL